MKQLSWIVLGLVGVLALPAAASAGPLQNRLNRQESRIYDGVQNGSLTLSEYRRLERKQNSIQAQRRRDIRDGGGLTPFEAYRLDQRLDRQSRQIYRQKHD